MRSPTSESNEFRPKVRSIRLDEEAVNKLLDALDEGERDSDAGQRSCERFRFRRPNVIVQLKQPGDGSAQAYQCHARDLSKLGIAVLHGGYVHTGSRCVVQLITTHGAWENVPGIVVRCRYLQSNIHEVSIRFEHEIEPGIFCPEAVKLRVLLAEDEPLMARLTAKFLAQANAITELAGNGQEALDKLNNAAFDLILTDIEMPIMDGLRFAATARAQGYGGLIVALTGHTHEEARVRCLEAGCHDVLHKPPRREEIQALLKSLQREPVQSSLANDPSMRELIAEFVQQLPQRLHELNLTHGRHDTVALAAQGRRLSQEASGFGFEPIAEAASALCQSIERNDAPARIKQLAVELASCCHLARSTAARN